MASFSTIAWNSLTYIDLMPWTLLAACFRACWAASSQLFSDCASTSMTLTIDMVVSSRSLARPDHREARLAGHEVGRWRQRKRVAAASRAGCRSGGGQAVVVRLWRITLHMAYTGVCLLLA